MQDAEHIEISMFYRYIRFNRLKNMIELQRLCESVPHVKEEKRYCKNIEQLLLEVEPAYPSETSCFASL